MTSTVVVKEGAQVLREEQAPASVASASSSAPSSGGYMAERRARVVAAVTPAEPPSGQAIAAASEALANATSSRAWRDATITLLVGAMTSPALEGTWARAKEIWKGRQSSWERALDRHDAQEVYLARRRELSG